MIIVNKVPGLSYQGSTFPKSPNRTTIEVEHHLIKVYKNNKRKICTIYLGIITIRYS